MAKTKTIISTIIVYSIFVLTIVLSFLLLPKKGNEIEIKANGRKYVYTLDEDRLIKVQGALGETIIEVNNKGARIISSPCKNKTCINLGFSKSLVCLPNKVIATIVENNKEEKLDAYSR